jgi:U1 small nuclear ribonucleoprotein 70kDa
MPPHIRVTFMPNPPLPHLPPLNGALKRKHAITGVSGYLQKCAEEAKKRSVAAAATTTATIATTKTPRQLKQERQRLKAEQHAKNVLEPLIQQYRKMQKDCGGEVFGMNCYNTLFVGRLAYEVTERKLLREMETFGAVKDIKIIKQQRNHVDHDNNNNNHPKSRGYAFVEYEHEEDMKRAYRAADGMRLEGRCIVVDVERGHTVPTWLPRRLGGGLGGTRLGGKDVNVTRPGRYDPSRPDHYAVPVAAAPMMMMMMQQQQPPPSYYPPPPQYPPQQPVGRGGPPPPPPMYGGGGGSLGGSMGRGGSAGHGGGYMPGGGPPPPPPPPPLPAYVDQGRDRYGDRGPPPPPRGDWDRSGGDHHKRRRSNSPPPSDQRRHHGGGRDSSRRRY